MKGFEKAAKEHEKGNSKKYGCKVRKKSPKRTKRSEKIRLKREIDKLTR
jgi:hypothetical protein